MYGLETSNGSWNGMIGLILEKVKITILKYSVPFSHCNLFDQSVDIAVGVFSVTHSRSQVVDFSVGFQEEPATILIPPPAEESRLLVCKKPFQFEVISVFVSLFRLSIIMNIFYYFKDYEL